MMLLTLYSQFKEPCKYFQSPLVNHIVEILQYKTTCCGGAEHYLTSEKVGT